MDLSWLSELFEQRDPTGEPRYSHREIEDLIATILLTIGFDPRTTPPVLLGIIEAFAERAGVTPGEAREASQEKIESYLRQSPLRPELTVAFQQHLRESFARKDTGALEQAFARFAATDLSKRAPDRKRTEGSVPGYLAMLAHRDID